MQEAEILEKFKKRGFNHLSVEDLATIQQSTTWAQTFKQATSEDWGIYSDKAGERLSHSSFNVKWVSKTKSSYSNLFNSVIRGDVNKLLEFLRVSDLPSCRKALDSNSKTALHLAAREGKVEVVKILIEKGWEVDVKDKYSTTPLQQACNMNHFETVSYLIDCGADPWAKDSLGRNALMYAVCGPGTESAEVLLAWGDFNGTQDLTGRTALHYAVFNPHNKQAEIFHLILKSGMSVNVKDNDGKTPLHHACESGKAKAIRWLVKHGADENAKDRNMQTPYDLASNTNIKKLLSLCNVSERTLKVSYEKKQEFREEIKFEPKAAYRDRLVNFLTQVQEAGILNKQHLKKPQIYSGNWMEGVLSPITLFNELSHSSPSEAVLKVFNVLFPYSKPVPIARESELVLDEFFGGSYSKSRTEIPIYIPDETQAKKVALELEVYKKSMVSLKESSESKDKNIDRLEKELKSKLVDIENFKTALFQLQEKFDKSKTQPINLEEGLVSEQLTELKSKLVRAEAKLGEVFEINERLQREVDLRPKNDDVQDLIDKVQMLEADNRNLRFKAGQIFLRSIEAPEEPKIKPGQVYIQDLEKLKRLHLNLKTRPPSLAQRLADADFDQDGKISKAETSKVLSSLELPPQDIISLLRLLGFRQGNGVISVEEASRLLGDLEAKERKLHSDLFNRVINILNSNSLGIEKAFEYLDVNHDGQVSFAEFSEGCESLHINLNREDKHALFSVLDSDHSGSINLHELKAKLDNFSGGQDKVTGYNEKFNKVPRLATLVGVGIEKNLNINEDKDKDKDKDKGKILTSRMDGSLVIGIVKGKDFGTGNFAVKYFVDGMDKPQITGTAPGPNPEWRHKGRVRIVESGVVVSNDLVLDVVADKGKDKDKGVVGSCKVPWNVVLDFPNVWASKDEYQVVDLSGAVKGCVCVHLMWVPKEALRADTTGNLKIQIVSYSGFPSSLVEFSLSTSTDLKQLKKSEEMILKDVHISGDSPVPTLKCTILKVDDRSVILWRNLSIEVALATNDWTRVLKVPLSPSQDLSLRFQWQEHTASYKQQVEAATKIQTAYRGYQVRKNRLPTKGKKLIGKKVLREKGVIYLIGIYEEDDLIVLELHEVSDRVDFIEVIDLKTVKNSKISEIFPGIQVQNKEILIDASLVLVSQTAPEEIETKHKKLIARRVIKRNQRYYMLSLTESSGKIKASLGLADDSKTPMYQELSSLILDTQDVSSIFARISIDKSHKLSLSGQTQSQALDPVKPLSNKSKVLKRQVLKLSNRYVMVSVFPHENHFRVVGNVADEPGRAMFETESELLVRSLALEEIFPKLQLGADLKIKIKI